MNDDAIPADVPYVSAADADDEDNDQAAGELDDATLADLLEITAAQAEKDAVGIRLWGETERSTEPINLANYRPGGAG